MNIERLEYIATWLEGGAVHERMEFDMMKGLFVKSRFKPTTLEEYNACNTVCCLAGAAVQFFNAPFEKLPHYEDWDDFGVGTEISYAQIFEEARQLLDLTHEQAHALFEPGGYDGSCVLQAAPYNNAALAAKVIRDFIATGNIEWEKLRNETPK